MDNNSKADRQVVRWIEVVRSYWQSAWAAKVSVYLLPI